ncbi:MAG TPA: hypothetical protein PL187_00225 [Caldilinea sp.]|nr:hypothetical protein [Caldilinea sp.]
MTERSEDYGRTLMGWIEALQIMAPHYPGGINTRSPLHGEHDEVYAIKAEFLPEDSEDGQKLLSMGWFVCEYTNCWMRFT